MPANSAAKYLYERGEGRFKHCWKDAQAGFVDDPFGRPVGKCSSKLDPQKAQELLAEGFATGSDGAQYPNKIYNVFEGVPYEATPTNPGVSYHGYPWRGEMPRWIFRRLQQRAEAQGFGSVFKHWVNQYSSMRL